MIFAFTGQPGAGKTLGAVEFVYKDSQFEGRPVYSYGVNGLNVPNWNILTLDEVMRWWELPEGSVVIIDECQDIWRPRGQGKAVPEHVEKLEKHRHLGFDFVLTFQFPTQIDTVVRNLITDHFHSHRAMGFGGRTVFHFDYLCLDPLSKAKQKTATKKIKKFNKEIFDLYESASIHTAKSRIPWFIYLLPVLIILLPILGYVIYDRVFNNLLNPDSVVIDSSAGDSKAETKTSKYAYKGGRSKDDLPHTKESYIAERIPLIKGDPRSAAIFDKLLEAKSLPRVSMCISSNTYTKTRSSCKCYSQQATWLKSIYPELCEIFIRDGYEFDYTLEDKGLREERRAGRRGEATRPPFDLLGDQPQAHKISFRKEVNNLTSSN